MSAKQDKATMERNAKTLRELLKRPENKFCADCKRNDPRWASWNLGVFLCIRCSGFHRAMGTHISKVKSVDLDMWTPEQMASIQKWGNRYANLYWEAHLKPGHIPPDHKMESFIRSKYESKRWAKDGPPPSDPSTLDNGASAPANAPPAPSPAPQSSTSTTRHAATSSVSSTRSTATGTINRQPQPHQLLSATLANRSAAPAAPALASPAAQPQQPAQPTPTAAPTSAANDLFSLDFHNPTPPRAASPPGPKKDVKQDILSLFSSSSAPQSASASPLYAQTQNVWGAPQIVPAQQQVPQAQPMTQQQQQPQLTSMVGQNGVGLWGTSSGWNAPYAASAQPALWGNASSAIQPQPQIQPQVQQQPAQPSFFDTNSIWASSSSTTTNGTATAGAGAGGLGGLGGDLFGGSSSTTAGGQKKDDVFGDIWGSFK